MKVFLLDLWHDLREKRLWPVAVVLLLALVAVPILLAKPAPDESGSAPAPAAAAGTDKEAQAAIVQLVEDATEESSSLRLFDPRDPFAAKGVKDLETLSSTDIVSAAEALTSASEEESGGGGGGSSEGGSEPSSGGGSTGGDTPPATVPNSGGGGGTEVVKYGYVIDVTFWSNGKSRRKTGMSKLEMLPNETSPLLIFLGVDSDGSDAVFLVDSSLKAEGEGACSPSPSDCGVLALGSGSQHNFTDDDGNSYTLRVDEIRRKRLSSASSSRARRKPAARTAVGPSGSRDEAMQARRFMPPILADLVTVASQDGDRSSSDKDRR